MGKFLAVVVGVVAVGLTLRFTLHHKEKPRPPKPAVQEPATVNQPVPTPEPAVDPTVPSAVEVAPPQPAAPEPSRIAGAIQISSTSVHHFATAPGVIYYCDQHDLIRESKTEGGPERIGDCDISSDLVADANGVFYSADNKVMRVTAGTTGSHVVADMLAIVMALDAKYVYFARPSWDDEPDPGVYRVERSGGTPERLHQRAKEQFGVVVDNEAVWITGYFLGTVTKLAKTGPGKPRVVLSGQKNLEELAMDATYLYWYAEGSGEIRRRKKTGGAIEVIGHDVVQGDVKVVDGDAYWFERSGDTDRLMHLAPGAEKAVEMATGLRVPLMRVDAEGVYISELDRDGIFMFKR